MRVMWWIIIRQSPAPMARAAVVYSISFTDSTWERTTRAAEGMTTMPMAKITLRVLEPSTNTSTIATIREGNAHRMSMNRWAIISTLPPQYEVITAMTAPVPVPRRVAVTPTNRDTRPPHTTRLKTSRPVVSVPNQ